MPTPKIVCPHCSKSQFLKHNMLHRTPEGQVVTCTYCGRESNRLELSADNLRSTGGALEFIF